MFEFYGNLRKDKKTDAAIEESKDDSDPLGLITSEDGSSPSGRKDGLGGGYSKALAAFQKEL